jgi:O-antigen ligase
MGTQSSFHKLVAVSTEDWAADLDYFGWSRRASVWEQAFAVVGLAILFGGFRAIFVSLGSVGFDRSAGNIYVQLSSFLWYGLAGILLVRYFHQHIGELLSRNWVLVALYVFALVSVAWSQEPETAFRRAAALALSFAFVLYCAARFPPLLLYRLVGVTLIIIALAGLAAAFIPGLGIHAGDNHAGQWRGLTGHKNLFGRILGLGIIWAWVGLCFDVRQPRILSLASFGLFTGLLLLTQSKTPLVAVIAVMLMTPLIVYVVSSGSHGTRLTLSVRAAACVLAGAGVAIAVSWVLPTVFTMVGRNESLTGRDTIWEYAIAIGQNHSILGAGFSTFWIDSVTGDFMQRNPYFHNPDAANYNEIMSNAHNGYLDVWLELGWVGASVFGAFLITYLFRVLRGPDAIGVGGKTQRILFMWYAMTFVFIAIYSYTESLFMQPTDLLWFFLCASYVAMRAGPLPLRRVAHRPASLRTGRPVEPRITRD